MISTSADVFGTDDDFDCFIKIDGVEIEASNRTSMIGTDNIEENCSTDAFYEITAGGTYAVDFAFTGWLHRPGSMRLCSMCSTFRSITTAADPARRFNRRTQSGLGRRSPRSLSRLQGRLFPRSPMVLGLSQTRSSADARSWASNGACRPGPAFSAIRNPQPSRWSAPSLIA